MRKIVFLDIDGTIAMPNTPPSAETVEAVRRARANGHLVFLSTGRAQHGVAPSVMAIGYDGGIFHAGGRAAAAGRELLNRPMEREQLDSLIRLLSGQQLVFYLETADGMFSHDLTGSYAFPEETLACRDYLQNMELGAFPNQADLKDYAGEAVYKIFIIACSREQQEKLTRSRPDWAKLVWFEELLPGAPVVFGEMTDRNTNKAAAMAEICRCLDISPRDCIAFGDSMNDAEILEAAGLGIAMGNADPQLKTIADSVCESCTDNGLAKSFRRLGLL